MCIVFSSRFAGLNADFLIEYDADRHARPMLRERRTFGDNKVWNDAENLCCYYCCCCLIGGYSDSLSRFAAAVAERQMKKCPRVL